MGCVASLSCFGCKPATPVRPPNLPTRALVKPNDAVKFLNCPLPTRDPLPQRPAFKGVMQLARLAAVPCLQSCSGGDATTAVFEVRPDGSMGPVAFVRPVPSCLMDPATQQCVLDAWAGLCFEASDEGIRRLQVALGPLTAEELAEPVSLSAGRGPVPFRLAAPRYPLAAARKGITGEVRLRYDVTANGLVENIVILESEPPGVFDKSIRSALSKWRYRPALDREGRRMPVRGIEMRQVFLLKD